VEILKKTVFQKKHGKKNLLSRGCTGGSRQGGKLERENRQRTTGRLFMGHKKHIRQVLHQRPTLISKKSSVSRSQKEVAKKNVKFVTVYSNRKREWGTGQSAHISKKTSCERIRGKAYRKGGQKGIKKGSCAGSPHLRRSVPYEKENWGRWGDRVIRTRGKRANRWRGEEA